MANTKLPRLFFVQDEGDKVRMHVFDEAADSWTPTNSKPKEGDHLVKNGEELVCVSNGVYEELSDEDEELWDYSLPDLTELYANELDDDEDENEMTRGKLIRAEKIA